MILRWYKKFSNDHDLDDSIVFIFSIKKKRGSEGREEGRGRQKLTCLSVFYAAKGSQVCPWLGLRNTCHFSL